MSTVSYLDRFLEPVIEAFTPALARKLVDLRIDPNIQAHIDVLRSYSQKIQPHYFPEIYGLVFDPA